MTSRTSERTPPARAAAPRAPPEPTLEQVKQRHVLAVLLDEGYQVRRAATRLGISSAALYARLRRMGLDLARRRRGSP